MLKNFFKQTDHLECGNPDCNYDGEWCYHFTDKDYKELELTGENAEQLRSFIEYCREHPNERFWQALQNWSEYSFILGGRYAGLGENPDILLGGTAPIKLEDTFYV